MESSQRERRLEGRRVAVAGAGGSLGPVVVRALAREGAWVSGCERDAQRLEPLADVLGHAHVADLTTAAGAQDWARAAGTVDVLLHLVGGWRGGQPLHEAPDEDLAWLHAVLFDSVVQTTRAFAPVLRAAGPRGRFALVSARQARHPSAGNAAYAATKAAAETWALAFGAELAETGGTANAVVVNALVTPQMRAAEPEKAFASFTDVGAVAEALVFLCTDEAGAMNGQRLALHGP
jgi:NAD(P)-dependent dehydrogenase (short-subunit alcohol dehydrogenase family)